MRLIKSNIWNVQRVLHAVAATQEVPRHTRLHSRGSTRVPPTSRGAPFPPQSSRGGSFPCVLWKEFQAFPSHLKRRRSQQERREELQGRATITRVPQMSQSIPGKPVFPALPRLSSPGSTHITVARGTALWESLLGNSRGKALRESHRSLEPLERKRDTAATAREESARACPHSRRRLIPLWRLQKYPKIHVSTGEASSVSGTDAKQGLSPRHRQERNPKRSRATHMGTVFLEATRAGPRGPRRKSRAPAATRENPGGSPLQAR